MRINTYLVQVKDSTGVKTRLLVHSVELSRLVTLLGEERGDGIKLETLNELVLNLNLGPEQVCGGPGLGKSEAVLLVGPLALEVTLDGIRTSRAGARNLEGHVGWGLGLHLEPISSVGKVLVEEVIGGLSEVL
jgi:hypothetical protein